MSNETTTTTTAAPHVARDDSEARPRIVGGTWGISIVVVIAMIAAAVANVQQLNAANTRTTSLEAKLDGTNAKIDSTTKSLETTNETLKEIRNLVGELASATAKDITALQRENADLRERVTREVGELRLQIAEVRTAMLTTGR